MGGVFIDTSSVSELFDVRRFRKLDCFRSSFVAAVSFIRHEKYMKESYKVPLLAHALATSVGHSFVGSLGHGLGSVKMNDGQETFHLGPLV
jgi:hypothetical protein